MKIHSVISIRHIQKNHREDFVKLANLIDDQDESNVEVEVEFDDWQPEQRESWGHYGGCEYIASGYCSIHNLSCKGVNILNWVNENGHDYIIRNQGSFVEDYDF
jgi:hypothetical protein